MYPNNNMCEQIRRGRTLASLGECLKMEYRVVQRLMRNSRSDFYEGVRAVLVDKDNAPRWRPASLSDVSAAAVEAHFALLPHAEELRFDGESS